MKTENTAKKVILFLLVLLVLFIPTYIALGSYYSAKPADSPVRSQNTYLEVKDPTQRSYEVRQDEDFTTWSLFTNMITNGISVSEIPDSVDRGQMLLATFVTVETVTDAEGQTVDTETKRDNYAFYFSTTVSNCYFMDPEQKVFRIADSDVMSFLQKEDISKFLFKSAVTPVLTVLGTEVPPASLEWSYLAAGNIYQTLKETNSPSGPLPYASGDAIPFSFTVEPSVCTVKVMSADGMTLYDGAAANLNSLSLPKNTLLSFEAGAEWYKSDGKDFFGTAKYSFTANLSAPAVFSISSNGMNQGDFVTVSVMNVTDPSAISFSSRPALPYQPTFTPCGDGCLALIPVSYGCENGDYIFSLSCGSVSEEFTVRVTDYLYGYKTNTYEISTNLVNTNYTEAQIAAYTALVENICKGPATAPAFSGAFLNYENKGVLQEKGSTIKMGFGRNINVYLTRLSFEHTGVDFSVASQTPIGVPALNNGTVDYVGTDDVLGKFVVVDHGCGLRTWYAHLTDTDVKVGDAVATGQSVGKTAAKGNTGFTVEGRVHIGVTVGNQPVAPYSLWVQGVPVPDSAS